MSHSIMKRSTLLASILMTAFLAACTPSSKNHDNSMLEDTPPSEQDSQSALGPIEQPTTSPDAIDSEQDLPTDRPEAIERLDLFKSQLQVGEYHFPQDYGVWSTFDSNVKIADIYPVFTELYCEHDADRIFCSFGRMGSISDEELSEVVPYLFNQDLVDLMGELRCSAYVCINNVGQLVGAIQPEMKKWMSTYCMSNAEGRLSCS